MRRVGEERKRGIGRERIKRRGKGEREGSEEEKKERGERELASKRVKH